MFGKKKAAAAEPKPKLNAAVYIVKQINEMKHSNINSMIYGMLCFAFDFQLIDIKERQALGDMLHEKTMKLMEIEKAKKQAEREEKARIIAEYEAQRKEKAKAEKAKLKAEGKL